MSAARQPKIPGPDHPITVTPNKQRVLVRAGGALIADTREALTLQEASYPAVQYIPRKDVDMALLTRTEHTTVLRVQRRLQLLQHPARRRPLGQRGVDL